MEIASIAGSIGSTILGVVGQLKQASATEAQAKYQMQVARNNQILTERYARDAEARGAAAVQRQQIQTKQLRGRQRAALAANGVQLDEGSALDITSDTLMIGELDALTLRSNAAREALGFRQQGMNFQNQAQMYKYQADNAYDWMGIGGTLLSGASSVASKWYQFYPPSTGGSVVPGSTFGTGAGHPIMG